MSSFFARALLKTYHFAGAAVYPLLGPYLSYRASKGKEQRDRRNERYGRSNVVRPIGPLIWFHAASVGETIAVIPLIEKVLEREISVVLTTGTVTSANIVQERLGNRVMHQFVPLDLKPAISNFLDHWKPDLAIISESEIWPMTILELGSRRTPQILVNGRMSDKSFLSWSRLASLADALFENLSHVIAQSDLDAERFARLGAHSVSVSGNLKVDTHMPPVDPAILDQYSLALKDRKTWAAISTFEGEDEIVANAYKSIFEKHKDQLLIIVPRHVERADAIEDMLTQAGLKVARRTRGDVIDEKTQVLLGDSTGEMGLYLRLTSVVFVGKSIIGVGGQNPLEPAMLDCAILSGPNVQNFRETYRSLLQNGAARLVKDQQMLVEGVSQLIENEELCTSMVEAGKSTIINLKGSLDKTIEQLEPYLTPLTIESRLMRSDKRANAAGVRRGQ